MEFFLSADFFVLALKVFSMFPTLCGVFVVLMGIVRAVL